MKKNIFYVLILAFFVSFSTVSAQDLEAETEVISNHTQTATITLTIEAPTSIIEQKSLLETAVIYWIDANTLVKRVKEHYWNQFNLNADDLIKNMEKEYWVDVEIVKNIAQELQSTSPAPANQKEEFIEMVTNKEIMSKREFVFRSVIIILCLYFLSYFLTNRELLHHRIHKSFWNILIIISFVWYAIIAWVYLINEIYNIKVYLPIDEFYQNLRIWLVIIFLWFSHALRYLFYYRVINKKARSHKIQHHHKIHPTHIDHKASEHKTTHKHNKKPAKHTTKKTKKS